MFDPVLLIALAGYVAIFALGCFAEACWRDRPSYAGDQRLLHNFACGALGSAIASLPWISAFAAVELGAAHDLGLFRHWPAPGVVVWAATAIALSLQFYWQHRAMHASDLLWRLHRLHHSDPEMDLSTGLRAHPGEYALDALGAGAVVLLLGSDRMSLLWALLLVQAPSLLVHVNARLPARLERIIGWLFVTPPVHLRHHSSDRAEHDSNYGNAIIVWDRLFGTYRADPPRAPLGL